MDEVQEPTVTPSTLDTEPLGFLKTVPLFQDLDPEESLEQLVSGMERAQFSANQRIFDQGEKGHLLYLLISGRVRVHLGDFTLAELTPGSFFGEMAVMDAQPRSASVTALEDCECWVLTQDQVYRIIHKTPAVAIALIRVLGARFRRLLGLFAASEDLFGLNATHHL